MKKFSKFLKNILIILLIFYIVIANTSSSYARKFDDASREYLRSQTEAFINKYKNDSYYTQQIIPARFKGSTFYCCCTTGVAYVYETFLGLDLSKVGYTTLSATNLTTLAKSKYWTEVSLENSKPGDILVRNNHTEMVAVKGGQTHFNFGGGNSGRSTNLNIHNIHSKADRFEKVFSLNPDVEVYPTGTVQGGSADMNIDALSNATEDPNDGFYYQGIEDGSFAGTSSLLAKIEWLFNLLSQLADYIIGIITYVLKMIFVGWANVFVVIITDAIDKITETEVDSGNGNKANNQNDLNDINIADTENSTSAASSQNVNNPIESDNLYTPSSTELQPEGDSKLTIDSIVFNKVPLLDANIFTDTAGGYKLKDDSILKTLRTSIATWYYIIRNVSIAAMLLIIIYIGIKMAISTIASEKALYKSMLVNWVVGFLIIFFIHYFLMFILNINSTLLTWITKAQQNMGYEDTIYEVVRTKAYEVKFSSGMLGAILYIALIIIMLKFFYVYIKRLLAISILTIMAPVMGASYAISKVRTGKAKSFTRWMKDFTLLVLIQSVHALIYVTFVTIILKLTEQSMPGIMLSLIFLNFMLKASKIVTNIFGMTGGKTGSRTLNTILNSDLKAETFVKYKVAKAAVRKTKDIAKNTIEFGKDIKDAPWTGEGVKQMSMAKGLGLGHLTKKQLGIGLFSKSRIDTATGQYIPPEEGEYITSLSNDLAKREKEAIDAKKNERRKYIKGVYKNANNKLKAFYSLGMGIPLNVTGFGALAIPNMINATAELLGASRKLKKKPKKFKRKRRFTGAVKNIANANANAAKARAIKAARKAKAAQSAAAIARANGNYTKATAAMEKISSASAVAAQISAKAAGASSKAVNGAANVLSKSADVALLPFSRTARAVGEISEGTINEGEAIQNREDFKLGKIAKAKELENNIINAYRNGRQNEIDEMRGKTGSNKTGKFADALGKLEYNKKFSDTVDDVFRVSDTVDNYSNTRDTSRLDSHDINNIKGELVNQVEGDIRNKIENSYRIRYGDNIDSHQHEVQQAVKTKIARFSQDLQSEVNKKLKKGSISTEEYKTMLEDMMEKHHMERDTSEGMEYIKKQMKNLQRTERDYMTSKLNPDHAPMYQREGSKKSNLRSVIKSLSIRNIE